MSEPVETFQYPEGYTVKIYQDDDPSNPMTEYDCQPLVILHAHAERHCGWTTDKEWASRLNEFLEHRFPTFESMAQLHTAFVRWARAYHRVAAILPFTLYEHSGQSVSIGTVGRDEWDSGWVGYVLITDEQWRDWQGLKPEDPVDHEAAELSLRGAFSEFASWVSGDCYCFVAYDPEGNHIASGGSFYGSESYDEKVRTEFVLGQAPIPGWVLETHLGDMTVYTVEEMPKQLFTKQRWHVQYDGAAAAGILTIGQKVTLVHKGCMREAFEDEVEQHRAAAHIKTQAMYRQLVSR